MTHVVAAGDVQVAYERMGIGPPLVLMHGAEASRLMFASLMPLLSAHFTVFAPDQRDCGDTQAPEVASTLADLADDAQRFIQALGLGRAHVFGSSFGGRVAQALALRHPGSVDRLMLGSTWPVPDAYEAVCPDAARLADLRGRLPDTAEELATWFFPEAFLAQRPDLRRVFAQARPATARSTRRAATVQTTIDGDAADIAAPTLLLAGELDRVVPPAVTLAMAERIRGARASLLPGVGHATALQAPEQLARHFIPFAAGQAPAKE